MNARRLSNGVIRALKSSHAQAHPVLQRSMSCVGSIRPAHVYQDSMSEQRRKGRPPHPDVLTPGEWRVVHAVQHGLSKREISARCGITQDAVKYHVVNAVTKLGVGSRQGLRRWLGAPRQSALATQEHAVSEPALGALAQLARTGTGRPRGAGLVRQHSRPEAPLYLRYAGVFRLCRDEAHAERTANPAPESILYLRVADIRAAYEQLRARGVVFASAPHMIHRHADGTEEWLAHFHDPEGRPLALMSQPRAARAPT
jgi:DNA-binding CsgD family transcriptional regulator